MSTTSDLLPLGSIVRPKTERPNLVENIQAALENPVRTLREYLFTAGIHGYFERIFQDMQEGHGGGYWVQAEYGGGKTHFLSSLLCLLGEIDATQREVVWNAVSDADLRASWQRVVMPRRLLSAHLSLMGTSVVAGNRQPSLVDLLDAAVIQALGRHGLADPGIRASAEIFDNLGRLQPAIREVLERAFRDRFQMSVDEHHDEYGDDARTASSLIELAEELNVNLLEHRQVQDHARHVLDQVRSLGFDGLVIVVDEYLSRFNALTDDEKNADGAVFETLGYMLGRQAQLPLYVVVASQGPMPAKLQDRFDPLVLLRDQDKEYSQIVCKRIMDELPTIDEQAVLYHAHFSRTFSLLRRTSADDTRAIFPFQTAVFRYLRDLVGSHRLTNAPSARFAIGVAYDTIAAPGALDVTRFLTTSDLMAGKLESDLLSAPELQEAAAALRQARDFIDNAEWEIAYLQGLAHRIVNHLFLDAVVRDQPQTLDQVVEGTLIEAQQGATPPREVAKIILRKLQSCDQIENKGDTWRFASRVSEGEQFESVFVKVRRDVPKTDPRVEEKWVDLLTAPLQNTAGVMPFLSPLVSNLRLEVDHSGVVFPGRASYVSGNLAPHLTPLSRLTQPDRVRVLVVPRLLPSAPPITDAAVAVVVPGPLPDSALDQLRGLVACQEVIEEYANRIDAGAEKVKAAAEQRSRELTRTIIGRQVEVYREGDVLTKDSLPLPARQLFKDGVKAGVEAIAQQLVRHAYAALPGLLQTSATRRGALNTADVQKVFDALFGGVAEPRTKGAAEAYGPVLGLSTTRDPTRLVANAGQAPEAVAAFIEAHLPAPFYMDEAYEQFCNEPYGLSASVVDLLVLACVALGKPTALELRFSSGAAIDMRDRRPYSGPVRAGQLRNLAWPRDGLQGCQILQSHETSWNDFVPVAQAVDPQRFTHTADQRDVQEQEKAFVQRLGDLHNQWSQTDYALRALREASGADMDARASAVMQRMRSFTELREDFDRQRALKLVQDTWGEDSSSFDGLTKDVQQLGWLAQLVAVAPKLAQQLGWFRTLAAAPNGLADEIEITAPLLSLERITGGQGNAVVVAEQAADELHARYMARYRDEHKRYVAWQEEQTAALERAARRLPTLQRLNQVEQLGPPDLPSGGADLARVRASIVPCERRDDPDVGAGLACLGCQYQMGSLARLSPAGSNLERDVVSAIERRSRSLSQGLVAETLEASGGNALTSLLAAAQAGSFEQIVEKDLLSDELVVRINAVLQKSNQQSVPSERAYQFLQRNPSVTRASLDRWLNELRQEIVHSLEEAATTNPGREITLLLRDADGR